VMMLRGGKKARKPPGRAACCVEQSAFAKASADTR